MKQSQFSIVGATLLSIFASEVVAFPGVLESATRAKADRHIQGRQGAPGLNPTFNERLQHVSTTGEHAFVAPNLVAGDQRGPCPGLNAMGMLSLVCLSSILTDYYDSKSWIPSSQRSWNPFGLHQGNF